MSDADHGNSEYREITPLGMAISRLFEKNEDDTISEHIATEADHSLAFVELLLKLFKVLLLCGSFSSIFTNWIDKTRPTPINAAG